MNANVYNYDKKLLTYNPSVNLTTNYKLISLFQKFVDINKQLNQPFKVNAYINAINNIKRVKAT